MILRKKTSNDLLKKLSEGKKLIKNLLTQWKNKKKN